MGPTSPVPHRTHRLNDLKATRLDLVTAAGESQEPGGSGGYFWAQGPWWRRVGATSIAVWGSTALTFVGTVIAARALGPDDYGAVVLAIATATFVTLFLDLTLIDGIVYYGTRALGAGDRGSLRSMLKAALLCDFLVGLVVAGLLVAAAEPIADVASGGEMDPSLIRLAALVGLVSTVDGTTGSVLMLARRGDLLGWTMAVANLARLLAILAAVEFTSGPAPVVGAYVFAALAGALAQLAIAWRVGWSEWRRAAPTRSARSWVRPLIGFGIHSSLAGTFQSTEKAAVPLILGGIVGPAAAGVYNVALIPVTAALTAVGPVRLMLLPEQAKLAADGDVPALRRTIRGFTGIAFAIAVPGAIAGWFLLPALIPALFSDRFDGAVEPARIMLIAAVFQFAIGSWSKLLPVAIGRPRLRAVMTGAYMLISVALTALLASGLESTGGAIATTVAVVSTSIFWWFLAERLLKLEALSVRQQRAADDADRASESIGLYRAQ